MFHIEKILLISTRGPPLLFCSAESVRLPRAALFPREQIRHLSNISASICCLTATRAHNPCLRLHSMDIKLFFLGLCALFCIFRPLSAQSTCKLKAKFNLGGYKDVEKKTVVVGGMFPVHKRVASNKGNTSSVPLSSGCVGWVGHVYVFFHHRCYAGLVF